MLSKLKQTKSEGFTIIEVMIVLAIAGLIILVVLLAVPALQRNGRNTAMKNDASAVVAGINEFRSNNDGKLPDFTVAGDVSVAADGTFTLKNTADNTTSPVTGKLQPGTSLAPKGAGTGPGVTKIPTATIWVYSQNDCSGNASKRAVTVWYSIETNNATANKCIDA